MFEKLKMQFATGLLAIAPATAQSQKNVAEEKPKQTQQVSALDNLQIRRAHALEYDRAEIEQYKQSLNKQSISVELDLGTLEPLSLPAVKNYSELLIDARPIPGALAHKLESQMAFQALRGSQRRQLVHAADSQQVQSQNAAAAQSSAATANAVRQQAQQLSQKATPKSNGTKEEPTTREEASSTNAPSKKEAQQSAPQAKNQRPTKTPSNIKTISTEEKTAPVEQKIENNPRYDREGILISYPDRPMTKSPQITSEQKAVLEGYIGEGNVPNDFDSISLTEEEGIGLTQTEINRDDISGDITVTKRGYDIGGCGLSAPVARIKIPKKLEDLKIEARAGASCAIASGDISYRTIEPQGDGLEAECAATVGGVRALGVAKIDTSGAHIGAEARAKVATIECEVTRYSPVEPGATKGSLVQNESGIRTVFGPHADIGAYLNTMDGKVNIKTPKFGLGSISIITRPISVKKPPIKPRRQ